MQDFTEIITVICLLSIMKGIMASVVYQSEKTMQRSVCSPNTERHRVLIKMSVLAQYAILRVPLRATI